VKLVEFTKTVLAQQRVRLIGVCFGHQIIGRALGVRVDRSDRGWEISVTEVELTEKGRELFGVQELVSGIGYFLFLSRTEGGSVPCTLVWMKDDNDDDDDGND
jgi:GMP synthase-like glutamine amidotransferase